MDVTMIDAALKSGGTELFEVLILSMIAVLMVTQALKTRLGLQVMNRLPKQYRPFIPLGISVILTGVFATWSGIEASKAVMLILSGPLAAWFHDVWGALTNKEEHKATKALLDSLQQDKRAVEMVERSMRERAQMASLVSKHVEREIQNEVLQGLVTGERVSDVAMTSEEIRAEFVAGVTAHMRDGIDEERPTGLVHPNEPMVVPPEKLDILDTDLPFVDKYANGSVSAFLMTEERRASNQDWPTWLHRAWNKERGEIGAAWGEVGNGAARDRLVVGTERGNFVANWGDLITFTEGVGLGLTRPPPEPENLDKWLVEGDPEESEEDKPVVE